MRSPDGERRGFAARAVAGGSVPLRENVCGIRLRPASGLRPGAARVSARAHATPVGMSAAQARPVSRLDSHIQQKLAQRDAIDLAARWLAGRDGLIVEFGLGTGRSYSHLIERFPGREVFCFDRRDVTHPRSRPSPDRLYLGEFADVLADPALQQRFGGRVMLLHVDVGDGSAADQILPTLILTRTRDWLVPGAVVLSDQELALEPPWDLERVDTRREVTHARRYFVYRRLDGRPGPPPGR